ncbi:MAG: exodeoxyribonuclease VII small subunit [Gemmatimonadota bacterium]|nr:exodeoxyribonuclease VII small subunit [Gemmatimonadota bacterium]MDE2782508.1 exodeoxyribonuclease VII small subunit [Gemmatimonadota bacterium]MDE2866892.1 exodeoxyribonuclease VII small subunit [Gemmatimonadota bacterium]MXV94309.1 exodeoxyribonuclease VII small subunit [Gemmatimonadota bacterium]MYB06057.1 exodeoxyribonuclease VII small subunit [Gemmatimonadota bacterium]
MEADAGLDRRLERIEEIVRLLDSDSLGLDEALALFEEGVGHIRRAREVLARTELRVEELIGEEGEEVREFEPAGDGGGDDAEDG